MAGKEQTVSSGEEIGATVRNVGVVIAVLGLITMAEALVLPAAGLAAGGEIFRRVSKPKK